MRHRSSGRSSSNWQRLKATETLTCFWRASSLLLLEDKSLQLRNTIAHRKSLSSLHPTQCLKQRPASYLASTLLSEPGAISCDTTKHEDMPVTRLSLLGHRHTQASVAGRKTPITHPLRKLPNDMHLCANLTARRLPTVI